MSLAGGSLKKDEGREMRKKLLWLIALSLPLILSTLAACTTPVPLSEDDEATIYAAVVRQLYTVGHPYGGNPPSWPVIYLQRSTDDRAGDPSSAEAKSSILAESLREAIVAALDDLPAEFIWVDDRREVMDESIMAVKDNGALITLGNTYLQGGGTVQVAASIYFAAEGGGGRTYIVGRGDGVWQVIGDTGRIWIS